MNVGKARVVLVVAILLTCISSASHAGYYEGKYKEWVDKLLTVAGPWDCPYNGPRVKAEACAQDRQVAAAVTSAWQAECLARDGENDKANAAAEQMYNHLKTAAGMCGKSGVSQMEAGGNSCDTDKLFDCESFQP